MTLVSLIKKCLLFKLIMQLACAYEFTKYCTFQFSFDTKDQY